MSPGTPLGPPVIHRDAQPYGAKANVFKTNKKCFRVRTGECEKKRSADVILISFKYLLKLLHGGLFSGSGNFNPHT